MTSGTGIRVWRSAGSSGIAGIEILGALAKPSEIDMSLESLCATSNLSTAAFVILRLAPTDHDGMVTALAAASARADLADARICLAIDRWTLARVDAHRLDTARAGILLDDVDGETPLSALCHEAVEAVRFRREFVEGAERRHRLGYALEAYVGLTRRMGLAALGPEVAQRSSMQMPTFDYIPATPEVANDEEWASFPPETSRLQRELQLGG